MEKFRPACTLMHTHADDTLSDLHTETLRAPLSLTPTHSTD